MKQYQLTYLISPDLTEEELKIISEEINNLFKEKGAILNKINNPIRRYLGYQIKNKREAFLTAVNFSIEPEKIKEIEKYLKGKQQIIRYTILTKKPFSLFEKPSIKKRIKEPKVITKIEKPKEKKVELKEIEKKLEEILEE